MIRTFKREMIKSFLMMAMENEEAQDNFDIEEIVTCRICYDEVKNEPTVSPCKCVGSHGYVHLSCLERWLSVSKSSSCDICNYKFKTVERPLTIIEWIREKKNCRGFCQQFSVLFFLVSIWCFVLIACMVKTLDYLAQSDETSMYCSGFLMSVITFCMGGMLWFWIVVFTQLWKSFNMVVRLDKAHIDYNEDESVEIVIDV